MTYLLTGLPALLREAGLTVTVADDATTNRLRNSNLVDVRGIVVHTTETEDSTFAAGADAPTWPWVRHGRSYGPTYHITIGRSGHVYVATLGQGGHAGTGRWPVAADRIPDDYANLYTIGVSMDANESGYPPTAAQREALARVIRALQDEWDGELSVVMHGEYQPASRRDPTGVSWDEVRAAGKRGYWSDPAWPKSPPAASPTVTTPATIWEVIDKGETLWAIAKRYGVLVSAIEKANPGINANNLIPGQRIKVPAQHLHVVQPGETLWGVAKRYGKTVPDLVKLNGIKNADQIIPGQVLKVAA